MISIPAASLGRSAGVFRHAGRALTALGLAALCAWSAGAQAETQIPVQNLQSSASGTRFGDQVDGATGAYQQSIAIEVPGHFGVEPRLGFSYSSNRGHDVFGVGWALTGLSTIERASRTRGTPAWMSSDVFLLDGQELISCAGGVVSASCSNGGNYATKIESYLRIKKNSSPNTWEVTSRDGTLRTYQAIGTYFSDSTAYGTGYRWVLASVSDTHGNTATYDYACPVVPDLPNQPAFFFTPQRHCYIDTISYGNTTVTFYRETRPDPILYSYGGGNAYLNQRIKTIDIVKGGFRVRAYKLLYNYVSSGTQRRRIASVQEFGKDAVIGSGSITGGTSLPAVNLTYNGGGSSFTTSRWATQQGTFGAATDWVTGDFNADGRTDFIRKAVASCTIQVRLSNGSGFTQQSWTVTPVSGSSCLPSFSSFTWDTGDFNGDGRTDLAVTCCSSGNFSAYVYLSTGTGFSYQSFAQNLVAWPAGSKFVTGDFDGDGKTEFAKDRVLWSAGLSCYVDIARSTGAAFTLLQWQVTSNCSSGTNGDTQVNYLTAADVNGDGRSDLIFAAWSSQTMGTTTTHSLRTIYIANLGTYFSRSDLPTVPLDSAPNLSTDKFFMADPNGDGVLELMWAHPSGTALSIEGYSFAGSKLIPQTWASAVGTSASLAYKWQTGDVDGDRRMDIIVHNPVQSSVAYSVYRSMGTTFALQSWGSAIGGAGTDVGDFNGDGKTDGVSFWSDGSNWTADVHVSAGLFPDLLTVLQNSLGGTATATYTASAAWANTLMPLNLQTVSSLATNDGRGNTTSTTFQYQGGLWDVPTRRFLGFASMTATLPCITGESTCPTVKTTYVQSLAHAAARPERVEERDGAGTLLRESVQEYTIGTASLPYTSLNTASWQTLYVGANQKRSKVTRVFDAFANVTELREYGDFDVAGDERSSFAVMAPNTTAYIVDKPVRLRGYIGLADTGTQLYSTYRYYDNATTYTTPPTTGDVTKTATWLDTSSSYVWNYAEYDGNGNVTATVDEVGNRSEFVYSSANPTFLFTEKDPLYIGGDTRHLVTYTWSISCQTLYNTSVYGKPITAWQYDQLCRPTRADLPGGGFAQNYYTNIGTPTGQWIQTDMPSPDGVDVLFTRQVFDGFGRVYRDVAKGTPTAAILVDRAFNARSGVATETAPYYNGDSTYTTTFGYDALDRATQRKHPDNNTIGMSYGFGVAFDKMTVTDELNRPVILHRDAYGRVVRKDQTLGGGTVSTHYQWDLMGRLTGVTDNAGNQWTYVYDMLGRRISAADPDLGTWTYQYDGAGRLTQQTDALGQVTALTYDGLGRVLTKTARHGTGQAATTTYSYDQDRVGYWNVGHLTTAANAAETITCDYDADGRLVRETHVVDTVSYTTVTGFDVGGRVRWVSYPDGDSAGSSGNQFQYDSGGRLVSVPGVLTGATYNARAEPVTVTRANGVVSTYARSAQRGWLTGVTTMSGATTVQDLVYGRDAAGRIGGVASGVTGEDWTYGYDDLDRLLSATNTDLPALTQSFAYDGVDNMTSNSAVGAYTYPLPGSPRPHAVTATPLGSYSYDANGNMTSAAGDTLAYDGENRLTSVNAVQFVYGADGHRLKKTAGATTTLYLGPDIEVTGGVTTKYLPGDARRTGTGGGAVTHWLHRDHLGSLRVLTDAAGAITQRGQYKPYGEQLGMAGPVSEAKGYIGERHDTETGLMYLNARYYDPVLARFMQADPSNPIRADVDVNRYAYAGNSPALYVDPSGLEMDIYAQAGLSSGQAYGLYGDTAYSTFTPDVPIVGRMGPLPPGYLDTLPRAETGPGMTGHQLGSIFASMGRHVIKFGVLALTLSLCGDTPEACAEGETRADARDDDEPRVTIYRAIGPAELDYLLEHGNYGHSPSRGGKYFAYTLEGATNFAHAPMNQDVAMTTTTIPRSVAEQGYSFNDPGRHGAGPSLHYQDVQLPYVYENMTPVIVLGPVPPEPL